MSLFCSMRQFGIQVHTLDRMLVYRKTLSLIHLFNAECQAEALSTVFGVWLNQGSKPQPSNLRVNKLTTRPLSWCIGFSEGFTNCDAAVWVGVCVVGGFVHGSKVYSSISPKQRSINLDRVYHTDTHTHPLPTPPMHAQTLHTLSHMGPLIMWGAVLVVAGAADLFVQWTRRLTHAVSGSLLVWDSTKWTFQSGQPEPCMSVSNNM